MAFVARVALISEVSSVSLSDVVVVSAALQKQVSRDFSPIWDIDATVDPFARLEDVPLGYWPIIIVDDVPNAAGVHLDSQGQPFALVEAGESWSLTASHECLEMLADPFGDQLVAGKSVKRGQGRVEYLVEVCDPSEAEGFAYTVNDILVSDFYTLHFFDPKKALGVQYSFGGEITRPRQVLPGGYLSWHDPVSDHWWQLTWFSGNRPTFRDLGIFSASDPRSIREIVDSMTPQTRRLSNLQRKNKMLLSARASLKESNVSSNRKAKAWREQIKALKKYSKNEKGK